MEIRWKFIRTVPVCKYYGICWFRAKRDSEPQVSRRRLIVRIVSLAENICERKKNLLKLFEKITAE